VEESGHPFADVDEDAELGEAVDRSPVVPSGRQPVGAGSTELERHVLLVCTTDAAVNGRAADDALSHYQGGMVPD